MMKARATTNKRRLPQNNGSFAILLLFCSLFLLGCATNKLPAYPNPENHPFYMSEQEVKAFGSDFRSFYQSLLVSEDSYVRLDPVVNERGVITDDISYAFVPQKGEEISGDEMWRITSTVAQESMKDAIAHAFRAFCLNNNGSLDYRHVHKYSDGNLEDITPSFSQTPPNFGRANFYLECRLDNGQEHHIRLSATNTWGKPYKPGLFDNPEGSYLPFVTYSDTSFFTRR